ncbi:hypothetical protein MLD38_011934 [Melastoma candidum]|uniref:Uncharacterized protein n=1 Tax=Melastoma candidum TaxID=119954 RepID=A0ACB9R4R3_9MYRT|nr:hypothetical protein MLD38_011934 [Melastoma candidum]
MSDRLASSLDLLPSPSRTDSEDQAEEEPLVKASSECRICQEEDSLDHLESPCACCGSLKVKPTLSSLLRD